MHYQDKVDHIFQGNLVPNRTLRTIFDCQSHEWDSTNFQEKENLLMKLYLSEDPLTYYVNGYKKFYIEELANKAYVVDTLAESIRLLIMNIKDDLIRASLFKIYVDLSKARE